MYIKRLFIALMLLHTIAVMAQDPLVAYYPFNGNADDASGNGYNGTVTGAALAPDRFGNADAAYYFDGNDHITVDETNLPNIDSSGYTVSLWVKPDTGYTTIWANILSYGSAGNGGYAFVCMNEYNGLYFERMYTDNSGVTNSVDLNSHITNLETWSMLTITYRNGIMKGYLNGVLKETKESMAYSESGYDFIIGASSSLRDRFIGWVDEVRVYNRALSDMEVAELSGLAGAVRAAELNPFSLVDFELQVLEPIQCGYQWYVWGASGDSLSYIRPVENPLKSAVNASDYVGTSVTFPTFITTSSTSRKKEYVLVSEDGSAYDHHHIMQWKFLLYDSTLLELDTIMWNWMYFNQIHHGYEYYDGGACENGGSIEPGGGIFNDNRKVPGDDHTLYQFTYRAMPDTALIQYHVDIGRWMTFTYEIFWTQSDTGYWRLWKDGTLLSERYNVKTVADCGTAADDFLHFKVGQYNKWNDPVIDSFPVYFDDIELYIDPAVSVEDICPACSTGGSARLPDDAYVPGTAEQNKPGIVHGENLISIILPGAETKYTVRLVTVQGRTVTAAAEQTGRCVLATGSMPAGIYLVEIINRVSAVQHAKIIIR